MSSAYASSSSYLPVGAGPKQEDEEDELDDDGTNSPESPNFDMDVTPGGPGARSGQDGTYGEAQSKGKRKDDGVARDENGKKKKRAKKALSCNECKRRKIKVRS